MRHFISFSLAIQIFLNEIYVCHTCYTFSRIVKPTYYRHMHDFDCATAEVLCKLHEKTSFHIIFEFIGLLCWMVSRKLCWKTLSNEYWVTYKWIRKLRTNFKISFFFSSFTKNMHVSYFFFSIFFFVLKIHKKLNWSNKKI